MLIVLFVVVVVAVVTAVAFAAVIYFIRFRCSSRFYFNDKSNRISEK